METRICRKCGQEKRLSNEKTESGFHKASMYAWYWNCKVCRNNEAKIKRREHVVKNNVNANKKVFGSPELNKWLYG